MKAVLILAVLLLTENGLCFFTALEDTIKGGRRSFDFQQYPGLQSVLDTKFQDFLSRKGSGDNKRNEDLSFDDIASKTTLKSSGLTSNNTIILEVTTLPSVDTFWMYMYYGYENDGGFTRGDVTSNGDMVTSSFTMSDDYKAVLVCIIGPDFATLLDTRKSYAIDESTKTLSNYTDLIKGPFNVTMDVNGTLEFDIKSSRENPADIVQSSVSKFVTNGNESYMAAYDVGIQIEQTATQGSFHVTGNLGGNTSGKQYWLITHIPGPVLPFQNSLKYVTVIKRILFEEAPQNNNEVVTFNFGQVTAPPPIQLTEDFHYGGLFCFAAGRPAPTVEIWKGEQRLYSNPRSYLRLVSFGLLSFDGQSVDNVTGTYVCKATSGNITVERQYTVTLSAS